MPEVNVVTITLAIIIGWLIMDALIQRANRKRVNKLRDDLYELDTWVNGYEPYPGVRWDTLSGGELDTMHPLYEDADFSVLNLTARGKRHTDSINRMSKVIDMLLEHNGLEVTNTPEQPAALTLTKIKPVKKKGKK